jgi:hypothetical protein
MRALGCLSANVWQALVADSDQHVRASVAKVLMPLSEIIGKDMYVSIPEASAPHLQRTIETLLPLFLRLLKDPVC